MQLPKCQLSKIIVLVEFVIYGGLRTPWVPQQLRIDGQILSIPPCVPVYTQAGFSYRTQTARKAPLSPLNELLVGSIGSIVNSTLANDSKKLAL